MFGRSIFRDDPFFNQPTSEIDQMMSGHHAIMDRMMSGFHGNFFNTPSLLPPPGAAMGGGAVARPNNERHDNNSIMSMHSNHFNRMFTDMNTMFSQAQANPDAHCFSSSRTVQYVNDGNGTPKYYEATSESRQGPGGVRQTRKSERSSKTGIEKMAIGHHIYDRGHVVEKSKNRRNQQMEEKHDYLNMDEEEKGQFYNEWNQKSRPHTTVSNQRAIRGSDSYSNSNNNHHREQNNQGGGYRHHRVAFKDD